MRNTTISCIFEEAKRNSNIILLTADLGYSVMEKLLLELPKQCINTGIAEQNMIGVAAGLALSGKKVFVYTIAPFATMRCFEQIRVDACYQNLDVTIIGVGGGFAYGTLGTTHYALEDIAIMRSLPNMKVFCPADSFEAELIAKKAIIDGGPSYIRLNRGGEQKIGNREANDCDIDSPGHLLGDNNIVVVIACGNIVEEAHRAVESVINNGRQVSLYSLPVIKPLNKDNIVQIIKGSKVVVTVEEHNIIGGLGSAIAEIIAESCSGPELVRLGVNDEYFTFIGKQDFMRDAAGISAEKIEKIIMQYV